MTLKCFLGIRVERKIGEKLRAQERFPSWKKVWSDQHAIDAKCMLNIDSRSMRPDETLKETT